jgi:hypothetical protein
MKNTNHKKKMGGGAALLLFFLIRVLHSCKIPGQSSSLILTRA